MSVWGVTMVKDEADVIEQNLRHLHAEGLAGVICLDNGSTDDTRPILNRLAVELPTGDADRARWLIVVDDDEPGYWQSAKMTSAMKLAESMGATWVIPFDADEIWYDTQGRRLAESVMIDGDEASGQWATLYNHFATSLDPVIPADVDDPFTRLGWRHVHPGALPKIAVRASATYRIEMGNHSAQFRYGEARPSNLALRHFPYRSVEQMVRKVRHGADAINATTMSRSTCQHWREMGVALDLHGPSAIEAWYRNGFCYERPAESGLIYDPAPLRHD
jgi:hypothetical protein